MINFYTLPTDKDPLELITSVDHARRRHDSLYLLKTMAKISGKEAIVWGEDNIGFGEYHYVYKTGKSGVWPIISFTPSIENISINVLNGFADYDALLEKIGKVKHTPNTLILHKLSDISKPALEKFIKRVFHDIQKAHASM
tara:strand:- start:24150 stop:24572 length:423 start_codon:yes stop_codon:yes gene_type:complete